VNRVLGQGLAELRLYDHRRALHAYGTRRGLGVVHDGSRMRLSGPDFTVAVRFNEQNLMVAMSSSMGGSDG
jgi:hypothetical protein